MLKIIDATRNVLLEDEVALQAMSNEVLNLSAYAERILPLVEAATFKSVRKGSIVVALSRLSHELTKLPKLRPFVAIDTISVKSQLSTITFDNTQLNRQTVASLYELLKSNTNTFFVTTQSTSEITLILHESIISDVLDRFSDKPKALFRDQSAVLIQFDEQYLDIPNVLFSFQTALALKRINLTEVISTYTEFCIIVNQDDVDTSMDALKKFLR